MLLQLLRLARCPALRACSIYLQLCVSALSPPASCPRLALYLCPRLLSALSGSDDSSGIGMKVTQGNKGPAVSTEVGVESGTQEFPARLLGPCSPAPWGCTLKGLVMVPFGSRLSFDSQMASGNPVSPLSCYFSDWGSQLPLTFLP